MKKTNPVFKNLQRFANNHKLILEDDGECGFGRPCVGFLSQSGNWLDHNPINSETYESIWPDDERLYPPKEVDDAYHKHDCMAVLVHNDNYDEALQQLNKWVKHLESQGELFVQEFETGAKGMQAVISGVFGWAIRIKATEQAGAVDAIKPRP